MFLWFSKIPTFVLNCFTYSHLFALFIGSSQASLPENKVHVYRQAKLLDLIATVIIIFTQESAPRGAEHHSQMDLKSRE